MAGRRRRDARGECPRRQLGPRRGGRLELDLWEAGAGPRHFDGCEPARAPDAATLTKLVRSFETVLGESLTSQEEERARATSDTRYGDARSRHHRSQSRSRLPLVLAENVKYGMRRNRLGLTSRALPLPGISFAILSGLNALALVPFASGELQQPAAR